VDPSHDQEDGLTRALLEGFERLSDLTRRWDPAAAGTLAASASEGHAALSTAVDDAAREGASASAVAIRVRSAARQLLEGFRALAASEAGAATAAARSNIEAQEALYEQAWADPALNAFYVPAADRADTGLLTRLAAPPAPGTGVTHLRNERDQRGGASIYVPEQSDGSPLPLVVALHGASWHGRDFLWTWLKAARARGVMVVSPTSFNRTWSMVGPDLDGANVRLILEEVVDSHPIDLDRVLLTGMSDGGLYAAMHVLRRTLPATHLAPIASGLNAEVVAGIATRNLEGFPVYQVHGTTDWVIPVSVARDAHAELVRRGAAVTFRELPDLGHAYPREENPRILDWFLSGV